MTEHEQKYEEIAQEMGVECVISILKAHGITPKMIRDALAQGDKHLNSIPLARWDVMSGQIRSMYATSPRNEAPWTYTRKLQSLSMRVCLLKHVARHHYAKEGSNDAG